MLGCIAPRARARYEEGIIEISPRYSASIISHTNRLCPAYSSAPVIGVSGFQGLNWNSIAIMPTEPLSLDEKIHFQMARMGNAEWDIVQANLRLRLNDDLVNFIALIHRPTPLTPPIFLSCFVALLNFHLRCVNFLTKKNLSFSPSLARVCKSGNVEIIGPIMDSDAERELPPFAPPFVESIVTILSNQL